MSNKKPYPTPPIAWLYMTMYTHEWLKKEFGGAVELYGRPVLSIAHLPGAKDILRMETQEDIMQPCQSKWSMSAMRMDCMVSGIDIGPKSVETMYGVTKDFMAAFVPIECPRMALTERGVLRPWNRTTTFGPSQSAALCKLLRGAFWEAVADYDAELREKGEAPGTAIKLISSFCAETGTPDIYADDLRREWQRQCAIRRKTQW